MDNSLPFDEAESILDAATRLASYFVDLEVMVNMLQNVDIKLQKKAGIALREAKKESIKILEIYKHPLDSPDPDLSGNMFSLDSSLAFDPFYNMDDEVLIQFKSSLREISYELQEEFSNPQISELVNLRQAIDNFESHSSNDLTKSLQIISRMPENQK